MLTKPCPSFSNVKHATSTAGYRVNEIGGSAREIVLDIVSEFGCRNDSGGIYKLTSFTLGYSTSKVVTIPAVGYYKLGFLCVERILMGCWRKWKMFQGHFSKYENSS